ncbi:MAG: hypothetical protein J0M04_17130 [Verrucomicrobia bacterium]|nr:hypothetical protein [Verrucomicrobiota bacterium]
MTRASVITTEALKITDSTEVIFDREEIDPIHQSPLPHFSPENQFPQWFSVYQWYIECPNYLVLRVSGSIGAPSHARDGHRPFLPPDNE